MFKGFPSSRSKYSLLQFQKDFRGGARRLLLELRLRLPLPVFLHQQLERIPGPDRLEGKLPVQGVRRLIPGTLPIQQRQHEPGITELCIFLRNSV